MKISKEFYDFCKNYLEAVTKEKNINGIIINTGLCYNVSLNNLSTFSLDYYLKHEHKHPEATTNTAPFNKDFDEYCRHKRLRLTHKNPYRLAFIKDIIETYEKN